jgi:pimeloyl-ACP methyl ester carboxylesterase
MPRSADFVFLHGGVQGGWVWDETLAALDLQTRGEFGRALALDVPGCGRKRGRDTAGLGIDEIAAELVGDIEKAGFTDVVLVGHSQAGTVLPRLVELRPELFRQVIYISCIAPAPGRTVLNFRDEDRGGAESTGAGGDAPPEPLPDLLRSYFCNDMAPDEADRFLARLGPDGWPELSYAGSDWRYGHLAATPSSYFICLRDAAVQPDWQERFADRLGCRSVVRFDSGHQLMNTRPHTLAEALRRETGLD